jgi:tryptophanyl-tRNA synthetase
MSTEPPAKQVLLSGIAASGILHLGNYIGALCQWVRLQEEYDCYWFIADLHALTVPHDIKAMNLKASTRSMAALYMAVGLDPDASVIFRQSDVPAHTELNWLLACATPTGWLNRMTQFKAKSASREAEKISTGLYTYPVLQAADILLYHPHRVPVGADQVQHVELARDIAQRFNNLFGLTFREPEALIPTVGARIMGLDDPTAKMSKTTAAAKQGHAIGLLDRPEAARKAIMRAQTDSGSTISFADSEPGVRNLLAILRALTGEPEAAIEAAFEGHGYGALKKRLADEVTILLESIQGRYQRHLDNPERIDKILADGARRAREQADATLADARISLGLDADHL